MARFPPNEKHWHGATAAMPPIPLREQPGGKAADWKEKASDEQYRR